MLLRYDPGKEDEEEEGEELEEWDESEDDTSDLSDIQDSLFEALEDVDEARLWAFYRPLPQDIPTPGLCLGQGGVVGLPLSSMGASRIKRHASQLGLESNPIVDDNDLTCDLDLSQFELRNPHWQTTEKLIGMGAAKPFDVGSATAQLRRLTLSGPSRPLKSLQEYVRQ